ncbi:MAG: hypothetical protein HPY50_10895 [Firmicutes bacterium]|nr:hypothetical protein [Bacillota bacterium]
MKEIRQRARLLMAATGIGVTASTFMLLQDRGILMLQPKTFLAFAIPATMLSAALAILEYKKLKTAELIVENQILYIQPAVIDAGVRGKGSASSDGDIEVFISGFGILLDSKVIKFNQDGVYLKDVEIGREYMCLTYGTNTSTRKTRILHAAMDSREVQDIVEKFRFETGVVPVVTD